MAAAEVEPGIAAMTAVQITQQTQCPTCVDCEVCALGTQVQQTRGGLLNHAFATAYS